MIIVCAFIFGVILWMELLGWGGVEWRRGFEGVGVYFLAFL